ncbi:MlaD family protein [Ascidiimonas sp. W6]|uniref:MlaD family protein n=1 Tax=Ascidiimonas meishanensis TaxID=3128903 RepID=UPI0030ECD0A3
MRLSREIKTAIIVLGGILLFILGFSYLKSNSIFQSYRTFYVVYDHVGGLAVGTPVTINGFSVGNIQDIRFKDNSGKLIVTFNVENKFEFSKNSIAQLYDTGIIGGKGIQVIPVFDGSTPAKSKDTLQGNIKPGLTELVTQKLTPLQEQIGSTLYSADSLLLNINTLLDDDTKLKFKNSINDLGIVISNFKNTSRDIDLIIRGNKEKLDSTLGNVANITENLSSLSDSLAKANIGKTVKDLQSTITSLDKVLASIERGEGSVGKLLKDESFYNNMSGASKQLELLLEDMKLNPKRYVHFSLFGKRAKPYEPPVESKEENK